MEKYIYIDDEELKDLETYSRGFSDTGRISMEIMDMSVFNTFEKMVGELKRRWNEFDGLLLDLRLNGEGINAQAYTATTLAQFLRTFCADEERPMKPIVLWSTDFEQHTHYDKDFTSHDLFDYVFKKSLDVNWEKCAIKLESLARGYKFINDYKGEDWSGIVNRKLMGLPETIFSQYELIPSSASTIARLIMNDLMNYSGILINEAIVAARLGIDKTNSPEWSHVLDVFSEAKYTGVFSEMGNYYWSDGVTDVFKRVTEGGCLASLCAAERVDLIKKKIGITNIIAASPVQYADSTMFWTVDVANERPLDPLEGFILKENTSLASWQDSRYTSFYAINSGLIELKQLLPAEKKRYEAQLEDLRAYEEDK